MAYFAGLDVSVKETSVCIVDDAGKIVREAREASEPEALLQVLTNTRSRSPSRMRWWPLEIWWLLARLRRPPPCILRKSPCIVGRFRWAAGRGPRQSLALGLATREYRWAEGHTERLPDLANQLVGLKVFDTLHAHHLDVR